MPNERTDINLCPHYDLRAKLTLIVRLGLNLCLDLGRSSSRVRILETKYAVVLNHHGCEPVKRTARFFDMIYLRPRISFRIIVSLAWES